MPPAQSTGHGPCTAPPAPRAAPPGSTTQARTADRARGVHNSVPQRARVLLETAPDTLSPLAGVVLDLCWILLPAAIVRFRHASVVVVPALVTRLWTPSCPRSCTLMGPIQVCRQTNGSGSATSMRPTRQGIGVGLWAGNGQDSLRLPSTEHGAARDGTEQAGTPSDGRRFRQAVRARHGRFTGPGGDGRGPTGKRWCDL
jgi:hypothetical protein